jgi:hypothetical protein
MQKIIVGLVGFNLILAGCLAVVLTQQSARSKHVASASSTDASASATNAASRARAAKSTSDKLSWTSLASPDLRVYARNLRRIGCPEETIKEIMLAEVNRAYSDRERALKVRPDDVAPWEEVARTDRRSAETKLRQLLEEKRSLLKELAGVDVGVDMPSRLAGRDVEKFETAFSSVPDAKRDQVRAIQENYWAQSDDIKQRTVGYLEPEDREEFVRIKSERRDALSKILTPQELQDYELKTAETAPSLRSRMEGFDISDAEFRKVFDYMQPLDEQYSLSRRNPDPENKDFTTARNQAEKDLTEYIHSVLGDDRYAEYQRTRDPAYRTINQIGTEAGLSKESILQAYQTQQQVQADAKGILQDASLSPEQRAQSLQALQAQAEQKIQQMFGDKGKQLLQRFGGGQLAERYGLPAGRSEITPIPGANNLVPTPAP